MKSALLFLLVFPVFLPAQTDPASAFIQTANSRITAIAQGWYDCTSIWKSAIKTDTAVHTGRVYFFRPATSPDSVGPFVLQHADGYTRAYDGRQYYMIWHDKKRIAAYPVSEKKPIRWLANRDRDGRLLFFPFIYTPERPPVRPENYAGAALDTFERDGQRYARIIRRDSARNQPKLTPTDPDWVQITSTIEYSLPELDLRRTTERIIFTGSPQYAETLLSPIHPLHESIRFNELFNLDSLLADGYTLADGSQAPARPPVITAGELLPAVALPGLDGAPVALDSLPSKLVLLDFWYKGCAPCLLAVPMLERLREQFAPQGFSILGVNVQEKDPEDIKIFMEKKGMHYPCVQDLGKQFAGRLGIYSYPTFILFDPVTRRVLHVQQGYDAGIAEALEARVEQLLREH